MPERGVMPPFLAARGGCVLLAAAVLGMLAFFAAADGVLAAGGLDGHAEPVRSLLWLGVLLLGLVAILVWARAVQRHGVRTDQVATPSSSA